MSTKRYKPEQVVTLLRQIESVPPVTLSIDPALTCMRTRPKMAAKGGFLPKPT